MPIVVCSLLLSSAALADADGDLKKARAAFLSARSGTPRQHLANGKTVMVDFSAPDRWRIQPTPAMTEVLIGNDVYMIQGGRSMKMPMGGMMISKMIKQFELSDDPEVKKTAQDLGTQTLNGRTVHVYSYTVRGVPETIYLGDDSRCRSRP